MKKNFLKFAVVAVMFTFAACSSDDSKTDCGAVEKEFMAAKAKYDAAPNDANCQAAVAIIKKALNAKCVTQEEADGYGDDLPCYTAGGNGDGNGNGSGDCASLAASAVSAVTGYATGSGSLSCEEVAGIVNDAIDGGCLTEDQIDQAYDHVDCL